MLPVEKQYYAKYPNPVARGPTVNKYAEFCQKNHMPETVKVIPKKNLVKATELSLAKGGDGSINEAILKLNEEVKVSNLNEKNFCCISHRFCTTKSSINEFAHLFAKVIKFGYFCGEDTCFEEKNHYQTMALYWKLVSEIVTLVFPNETKQAQNVAVYLAKHVTLLGIVDEKDLEDNCSFTDDVDKIPDLSDVSSTKSFTLFSPIRFLIFFE